MISYVFAQQGSPRGQDPPRMRSRIAARRCLLPEEKVVHDFLCVCAAGEPEGARPASDEITHRRKAMPSP